MAYLLLVFQTVSLLFALSAVATGAQAIVDPLGFSKLFGLPLTSTATDAEPSLNGKDDAITSRTTTMLHYQYGLTRSYISLMGVRQLATGIILLTFAYQSKWTEMATILAIIGVLVAGTDGIYLSRAGHGALGRFHAIPGIIIAALAAAVVYSNA